MFKNFNLIKNLVTIFILGISSGLPIVITASILKALLFDYNIDLKTIGVLGLVTTPYSFKFLWSPLIDYLKIPFLNKCLGHRKSWILVSQIFLIILIILIGQINPETDMLWFATCAFFLTFFSATQDICVDAYRIKILSKSEQGLGASSVIYGYRIGMIISGVGGFYIAEMFGWQASLFTMGIVILLTTFATIIASKAEEENLEGEKSSLGEFFYKPLKMFLKTQNCYLILVLVALYKLSDAYLGAMTMPFLMDIGYSKIDIANAVKSLDQVGTLTGVVIGGWLVLKLKPGINLFFAEILAMLSNLPFILINILPKNLYLLAVINGFENFTSSISNIAIVAYISNLSKNKYAATYYAILSSITAIGRTIVSSSSGFLVESVGWNNFFVISSLLSFPSLICIYLLFFRKKINGQA